MFHHQMAEIGIKSLAKVSVDCREFSAATMAIRQDQLAWIKREIRGKVKEPGGLKNPWLLLSWLCLVSWVISLLISCSSSFLPSFLRPEDGLQRASHGRHLLPLPFPSPSCTGGIRVVFSTGGKALRGLSFVSSTACGVFSMVSDILFSLDSSVSN